MMKACCYRLTRFRGRVDRGAAGPFDGRVSSVAPRGFEAYARVLHPVPDAHDVDGPNVGWAEVCACTGRRAHALMHWNAIAG